MSEFASLILWGMFKFAAMVILSASGAAYLARRYKLEPVPFLIIWVVLENILLWLFFF